jgi:hypothetical protein
MDATDLHGFAIMALKLCPSKFPLKRLRRLKHVLEQGGGFRAFLSVD